MTLAARFCRSSLRYQSRRDPLTGLRQRMRELAQTRARYGYRRLLVLLRREGWELGKSGAIACTSRKDWLRRKRPWRHATAVHREQRRPATARNDIWSMDVVADQLADGRRFRALTVLDLFTRECLAIDCSTSVLPIRQTFDRVVNSQVRPPVKWDKDVLPSTEDPSHDRGVRPSDDPLHHVRVITSSARGASVPLPSAAQQQYSQAQRSGHRRSP